jgi:mRNA-degrading endonuclease RelE of RelBE toxin-antitoxin system
MIYQVKITPFANRASKKFSPEVKKAAKAAMKELAKNPCLGKELQAELSGFWSYKFLRYRIIFKADTQKKTVIVWAVAVIVWAVGHRRDIYEAFGGHLLGLSSED